MSLREYIDEDIASAMGSAFEVGDQFLVHLLVMALRHNLEGLSRESGRTARTEPHIPQPTVASVV